MCQRSHADPRGRESFGETRCKSETNIKTVINKWLGTSLPWNKDNGLTLKNRNPKILNVFKCQNSLLEYFDTVKKLIEKKMQESIVIKFLVSAGKSCQTMQGTGQTKRSGNSPMLRTGQLANGCQFWQKVKDKRKCFNIAWTRTTLINSCTFEQSKDIQEVQSILPCKTVYFNQKILPSIFITSETEKNWGQQWIMVFDSRRSQSQNGQTSCILHCCESDG